MPSGKLFPEPQGSTPPDVAENARARHGDGQLAPPILAARRPIRAVRRRLDRGTIGKALGGKAQAQAQTKGVELAAAEIEAPPAIRFVR